MSELKEHIWNCPSINVEHSNYLNVGLSDSKSGWVVIFSKADISVLSNHFNLFENSTPNTKIQELIDFYGNLNFDDPEVQLFCKSIASDLEKLIKPEGE